MLRTCLFKFLGDWLRRWRFVCVGWHLNLRSRLRGRAALVGVFVKNCDYIIYVISSDLFLFHLHIVVQMVGRCMRPNVVSVRRAEGRASRNSNMSILNLTRIHIDWGDSQGGLVMNLGLTRMLECQITLSVKSKTRGLSLWGMFTVILCLIYLYLFASG